MIGIEGLCLNDVGMHYRAEKFVLLLRGQELHQVASLGEFDANLLFCLHGSVHGVTSRVADVDSCVATLKCCWLFKYLLYHGESSWRSHRSNCFQSDPCHQCPQSCRQNNTHHSRFSRLRSSECWRPRFAWLWGHPFLSWVRGPIFAITIYY